MRDLGLSARLATAGLSFVAAYVVGGTAGLGIAGLGIAGLGAAVLAAAFTRVGMPLFRRYALARPNARSSHVVPVPQGGGASVVAATLLAMIFLLAESNAADWGRFAGIAAGVLLLACVGAVDDIRGVPVLPRLVLQLAGVALVVVAGMTSAPVLPMLPRGLEIVLLVVAGAWFVNLTNFMDGIDGITLAGFLPLAAGAAVLAGAGFATPQGGMLAICFFGALAGFVYFNLPHAQLFPGDVGSLPIGLIGGALLLDLAQHGAFCAAVILPLYHFTDATLTLVRRILRREKVWEAHREHAYQNAVDGGWSHGKVSAMVLGLNIGLAVLAVVSVRLSMAGQVACVIAAFVAVGALIFVFRGKAARP